MLTELSIAVVIGLAFVVGLAVFVIGVVVIQRQVHRCGCVNDDDDDDDRQ